MRARYKVGLWTLMVAGTGCAGVKRPQESPVKAASSGPSSSELTKPDLSKVLAPKDLILVARAERLDNVSATLAKWMNLPFDLRMLDVLGPGLSQTLQVEAPAEAAVALADTGDTELPQPYAVFSLGIISSDAGRAMFQKFGRKLEETSPGVWFTTDESPLSCALAPALGRAQVRVVCGARRVDVENLLPYATRGLPLLAMGASDLHVEFQLAPIRERYGQRLRLVKAMAIPMALNELGISDPQLSRPVTDVLYALGDEIVDVIDDVDHLVLDARTAADPERVDVTTAVAFTRSHSWSAQTLADSAKRVAPAPPLFFELPKDASMASFAAPPNPKALEKIVHRFGSLLDGVLAHISVNAKVRDDLIRSLDQLNDTRTGPIVCAAAPGASNAKAKNDQDTLMESMSAWQICAYDQQPAATLTAFWDAGVRVAADSALRKVLGDKALAFRRRAVPAGLPAGTVAYELHLDVDAIRGSLQRLVSDAAPASKAARKDVNEAKPAPRSMLIVVVPDGTRTWWGYGTDAKQVVAHLLLAKRPGSDNRIGVTPELARLRVEPVIGGGYFTVAYFAGPFLNGWRSGLRMGTKGSTEEQLDNVLTTAPHHGLTPIPFTASVKGEVSAPELQFTLSLGRALFEDIVSIGGQSVLKMAK